MAKRVVIQIEGKNAVSELFDNAGECALWIDSIYLRAERLGREVVFHHEVTGHRFSEEQLEGGYWARFSKSQEKQAEKALEE